MNVSLLGVFACWQHRVKWIALATLASATLFVACSGGSNNDDDDLGPAAIEFVGAQNSQGQKFSVDEDTLVVACDGYITFELGPQTDTEGLLDNWVLRPYGVCPEDQIHCGYFNISFFDEDDEELTEFTTANIFPVLDLTSLDLARVAGATITLIDGTRDAPFLQDLLQVQDTWNFSISMPDECAAPPDGMGGMGGNPPATGGQPGSGGTGGFGGMGGFGGTGP